MQIRNLAGFKRLAMALAIASLFVAPAGAAATASNGKPGGGAPLAPGSAGPSDDGVSRGIEPVFFPRVNYAWPFSSGPVYGTVAAAR